MVTLKLFNSWDIHWQVKNGKFEEYFHYEKNGCFATGLATQFLNYRRHLQLIVFICHEW